jgi:hypothetical protein
MYRVRTPFEYCEDVFDGIYERAARALSDWDVYERACMPQDVTSMLKLECA